MWERMFEKEKDVCKQTVKNLEDKSCLTKDKEDQKVNPQNSHDAEIARNRFSPLARWCFWIDYVKRSTLQSIICIWCTNGCMLYQLRASLPACTPKDKDFVYGNLEPMEVINHTLFQYADQLQGPKRKSPQGSITNGKEDRPKCGHIWFRHCHWRAPKGKKR